LILFVRVTLTSGSGNVIIQTNGTEKVYDGTQPKTVNPFLAYTPNGTVSSVSCSWILFIDFMMKNDCVFD
jgi:hypothetical protein